MRASIFACVLVLAGCPGPVDVLPDAGSDGSVTDAPSPADAPVSLDATASDGGGADAAAACVPTPGAATGGAYCDLMELALYTYDDAPPRAELHGRFMPDGLAEGGCFLIDDVEVQVGGTTVATLPGQVGSLAAGPAFAELVARCEGDADRFGRFGFVVHGRRDGGTFTGRCADAEGGSRWPPAVRVTCHHNVDRSPFEANAMVSRSAVGDLSSVSVSLLHGPGGAITAVDGTIRIIPGFATAFGPTPMLDPFDSTGWMASVTEGTTPEGVTSQIYLYSPMTLPMELCPPPSTGVPGPGDPLPAVFLAGLTGTGGRGRFRTEAYVNLCYAAPGP